MGGRIWFTLILLTGIVAARAAEISPAFETELSLAKSGEFVSGIILLETPIDIQNLDAMLHSRKATRAERYAEIYSALRYNARTTQPKFRGELDAGKELGLVEDYTPYWIDNLFVVSAKPEFFNALKHRSDIRGLSENFEAVLIEPVERRDVPVSEDEMRRPDRNPLDTETTTPGLDAIGTTRVNRELGITGQGVLVANLDTGVDGNHPALAGRWRGLTTAPSAAWHDVIDAGPNFPVDNNDHGTHVMGTICGREFEGNGDTTTVGCAPDAEWIACNAIDQGVSTAFDNDVIDAYQWFADPDGDSTTISDVPDIVQNSWGVNQNFPGYTQCWNLWNPVILNLEALGCVVTFSAGNEGSSANTMRAPAIHEINQVQIFSVGAVSVPDGSTPPYAIASFSSRGPSPCDGTHIKPEIVAPGVNILSSIPGNSYSLFSGTSMAGPHIAGVVALMRQACPDCDPTTIKTALIATAIDDGYLPEGEDNVFGYGFVDAWAAVNFVYNLGSIGGVVTSSGLPLSDVEISVLENGRTTSTAADGTYLLGVSAGTYTVTFSKFGYITQTFENVVVIESEQTDLNPSLALAPTATVSGHVFTSSGQPEANALIEVLDAPIPSTQADANGFYSLEMPTGNTYTVRATGERGAAREIFLLESNLTVNLVMPQELYCYDFEASAQGWIRDTVNVSATRGRWGRMVPQQTINVGNVCQPGEDHTVAGTMCFVTDGLAGGSAGGKRRGRRQHNAAFAGLGFERREQRRDRFVQLVLE